jgi:small GTP-binding protein
MTPPGQENRASPKTRFVKLKICLVGDSAVGKTSLIRRFVFDQFDDKYIKTIGTKVTKKEITIQNPSNGEPVEVHLMIWDIMGDKGFRHLLTQAYFYGTHGIIGMCDITRKKTLSALSEWMINVKEIVNDVPVIFLGNKCDLDSKQELDINDIKIFATRYKNAAAYLSSVKTGQNVELAFKNISEKVVETFT